MSESPGFWCSSQTALMVLLEEDEAKLDADRAWKPGKEWEVLGVKQQAWIT